MTFAFSARKRGGEILHPGGKSGVEAEHAYRGGDNR